MDNMVEHALRLTHELIRTSPAHIGHADTWLLGIGVRIDDGGPRKALAMTQDSCVMLPHCLAVLDLWLKRVKCLHYSPFLSAVNDLRRELGVQVLLTYRKLAAALCVSLTSCRRAAYIIFLVRKVASLRFLRNDIWVPFTAGLSLITF